MQSDSPRSTSYPVSGLNQAEDVEELEQIYQSWSKKELQRTVAVMHMLIVLAMFCPAAALCISTANMSDVQHFIGRWGYLSLAFVLVALVVPYFHFRKKVMSNPGRSRMIFLASLWLPAVWLFFIAGYIRGRATMVTAALDNSDCFAFSEKRHLQRVWMGLEKVYDNCLAAGTLQTLELCPGFREVALEYPEDVAYLKALESRFPCGGFCWDGPKLFHDVGGQAPACSPFIAQWVLGARRQAFAVIMFTLAVGLAAVPLYALFEPFLKEVYWNALKGGKSWSK
mmetsp:Transcript_26819/g.61842  ORF Transcript_26819/g.61842 Transcript_26819/m.61842 type:complete len:283 (+) Transcript_26819:70-918(+)